MSDPASISTELQTELDRVAAEGDLLAEAGDYDAAIASYRRGFDLIPEPREGQSASLWFYSAIGDSQWLSRQFAESLDTWRDAIVLYGGFGSPFVHLRRGQALFELGDEKEASNELLRALLLGGEDIFAAEELDYWVFITSLANAPADYPDWIGWPGLQKDSDDYRFWTNPSDVYKFSQKPS